MWFFPRGEIPDDIKSKKPNPDAWPTPVAFFSSKACDMNKHFYEHELVLDTTLCGDFGNPTYQSFGCPGTCQEAIANTALYKCEYLLIFHWINKAHPSFRGEMED